jgi:hypothetical protein
MKRPHHNFTIFATAISWIFGIASGRNGSYTFSWLVTKSVLTFFSMALERFVSG